MTAVDRLQAVRVAVLAGRFADALETLAQLPGDVQATADAMLFQAMALWRTGGYTRSASLARQASSAFQTRGDSDGLMRSENVAAAADFALGNLAEARLGFTHALRHADTLGDDLMIARCANNLGNVAYYLADYAQALSSYRLAEASFESAGWRRGLAEVWLNRSIVFREMGDLDASLVAGDRAVERAESEEDQRLLGQGLATRAETHAHMRDFAVAVIEAKRAEGLAATEVNPVDEADALRVQCVIERLRGNADEAIAFGNSAQSAIRLLDHAWTTAEIDRDLGEALVTAGRTSEALTRFASAAETWRRMGATARADAMEERRAEVSNS